MNVKTKQGATIIKYGQTFRADAHPAAIELFCIGKLGKWEFRDRKCGNGLAFHIKEFIRYAWPSILWHKWLDLMIEEMCKTGRLAIFGPSSSGKSTAFSLFILTMFYARPKGTSGVISSTTLDSLESRIWGEVLRLHKEAKEEFPWLPGHLIESKHKLLADPSTAEGRSFKDGIVGVALKKGGQWQGLAEFVGRKNEVMIVGCDELQFCPPGVLDSLANLESNDNCFATFMGNLPDVHNSLAKAAEPKIGWEALPDTEKSRVYETRWYNGRAIQLIGMDSPNLDFPEGQEPFPMIIGRRYINQCAYNYGKESDKFNMFASGKIPKASMNRTVFNKAQCIKFSAMENVVWGHHELKRGYALDAAYSGVGGDRTPGAPFLFGKDIAGKYRFWLGEIKIYPGSDSPAISHCDAIALDVKRECEAHGIPPENMFYDGTGRSELTSSFARLWSSKVNPIEFGGRATERPSFTGEKWMDGEQKGELKMCCEVFDRFVTELWFAIRHCIIADQMRGLTEEFIEENCQRKWELVRGAKYSVEPKDGERDGQPVGMKARGLRSPDTGDMLACALEGARRMGFPLGSHESPSSMRKKSRWLQEESESEWERLKKNELQAA